MLSMEQLIKDLNKRYKNDIIMGGNDLREVEKIPFSSPKANYVTRGGIPKAKMSEFFGAEGSGKTTSALDILKNFQDNDDRFAVYLDAENTLNKEWGEKIGVDWSRVILIKPDNQFGETLLDMVLDCIRSGDVGFCVIDSVPFIVPKSVMEADLEQKSYAGNSALMTTFCSKVCALMHKYDCTVLMINQVRDKIGVTYTAYNTPGGRMLKHSCSLRVQFAKGSVIDEKGEEKSSGYENPAGNIVNIKIEKNKVSKPDRKIGSYTIRYAEGIDVLTDTIELAMLLNVVTGTGWYSYKDIKVQGKAKLRAVLIENEDLYAQLQEDVYNALME